MREPALSVSRCARAFIASRAVPWAMRCFQCDEEARAVCRFCGSGVCRSHAKAGRFVSGVGSVRSPGTSLLVREFLDYTVVENAIWCGRCTIRPVFTG
jgi:hypothetical protein